MMFQEFVRGVRDDHGLLDDKWAEEVLCRRGLRSVWLRNREPCDPMDWNQVVTPDALEWHVGRFDESGHALCGDDPFREHSPFISLSAGTVEVRHDEERNVRFPAWYTALVFATDHGTVPGWIFYGYVSVLGQSAVPLLEYAEEVRDLHQYDFYNPYHPEGEIVAKLVVPPVRLKMAIRVEPQHVEQWIERWETAGSAGLRGADDPLMEISESYGLPNYEYWAPESFSNVRRIR